MRLAEKRGGRYTVTVLVRLVQFERSGGLSKQQPALSFLIGNIAAAQRRFLSDCVWRPECFRFFLIGRIPGKGGRQGFQIIQASAAVRQSAKEAFQKAAARAVQAGFTKEELTELLSEAYGKGEEK